MIVRQAIVPVAGLGTRMLPLSQAVPKELLPLGPKPALQWVAEELAAAGLDRIALVTSPFKNQISRVFEENPQIARALEKTPSLRPLVWGLGSQRDVRFQTVIQEQQLGLGHAVLCGRDAIGPGPFVVALGDCVLGLGGRTDTTRRMLEIFQAQQADAVIALQLVSQAEVSRYGIVEPGEAVESPDTGRQCFRLRGIVEKPPPETAPSRYAAAGRYVFSECLFPLLESVPRDGSGEIQLTAAIQSLIGQGRRVIGVTLATGEERFDVGNYPSWTRAFLRFAVDHDPGLAGELTGIHAGFASRSQGWSETP